MIIDINGFKSGKFLGSRSSCTESLDWILSFFDSETIDLNQLYEYTYSDEHDVPEDWRKDADTYKQSLQALEYACKYNNVEHKETGKFRVRFVQFYDCDNLEEAIAKKEELINERIDILENSFTYSVIDGKKITKISKEEIDNSPEETKFKLTSSSNVEKIAETKSDIDRVILDFIDEEMTRLIKRIRIQKNITDPDNLFDVWVNE